MDLASILQQLFGVQAETPAGSNPPLPPPRPKDQSKLGGIPAELMAAPDPEGDSEASSPEDLALLAKMGAKNMDLPQEGKLRFPQYLNKDPGPAFYDDGGIEKYAASAIASDPSSPIAEYFRQQAAMALGNDPRAALLNQLKSGQGDIR